MHSIYPQNIDLTVVVSSSISVAISSSSTIGVCVVFLTFDFIGTTWAIGVIGATVVDSVDGNVGSFSDYNEK